MDSFVLSDLPQHRVTEGIPNTSSFAENCLANEPEERTIRRVSPWFITRPTKVDCVEGKHNMERFENKKKKYTMMTLEKPTRNIGMNINIY